MSSIDDLIYGPNNAITYGFDYLKDGRETLFSGLGLHFPVPEIAESYPVPPLLPGKVCVVSAVTSNGKSTFKDFWMGDSSRRIQETGSKDHILVSILAEDMVEEQMVDTMRREAARRGKIESIMLEEGLLTIAAEISDIPIYYIGASIARADINSMPNNMTNISAACLRIRERRQDKNLDTVFMGVFLDYIQALDLDVDLMKSVADKRRYLQVKKDFFTFRKLMAALPAPGVCCAQCKTELRYAPGKDMLTPGLLDIQESSAIAQHTDRAFSLWMPKTTHAHGRTYEHGKIRYKVIPNLVFMRCTKQRDKDPITLKGLPSGRVWSLMLDFDTGQYWHLEKPEDTIMADVPTRAERRIASGKDPLADW